MAQRPRSRLGSSWASLQRKVFGVPGRVLCHPCFCSAPAAEYHVKMLINIQSVQSEAHSSWLGASRKHPACSLVFILTVELKLHLRSIQFAGHRGIGWL